MRRHLRWRRGASNDSLARQRYDSGERMKRIEDGVWNAGLIEARRPAGVTAFGITGAADLFATGSAGR
ncbi:MAG: hypothetical protein AAF982_06385 [Pseudomonadota bacterium]